MNQNNELNVTAQPAIHVIGQRVRTNMANASADCGKLFQQFGPRMPEIACAPSGVCYGISWMADSAGDTFDYWAALPAQTGAPVPSGMEASDIPEGLYVECPFNSIPEISGAFNRIFKEWLPAQTEYTLRNDAPSFEMYPPDFMQTGKGSVFMPVVRK